MNDKEKNTFAFRDYLVTILLIIGTAYLIKEAILIYKKVPKLNGPGTLPLILLGIMAVTIIIALLQIKKQLPVDREKYQNPFRLIIDAIQVAFPLDVFIFLVLTILYLIALALFDGYIVVSVVYMLCVMLFFARKELTAKLAIKSLVIAIVIALSCYLIFGKIFMVTLP